MSDLESFLERYEKKFDFVKTLEDYDKGKERLVYRRFMKKLAGSNSLIESFDDWVDNIFKLQIENQSFVAPDGTKIDLKNPKIHKPVHIVNGEEQIIYPQYCRDNSIPYKGRITLDCEVTKPGGEVIITNIELGHIPIMLGSKLCNLRGKTEEELVELKECITDPFGYFLLKTEKSVIIQDKKRVCFPMVFFDTKIGKLVCEYTSYRKGRNGSKVFRLVTGKKWGTIKMSDNYDKQNINIIVKNIPIFIVFKLLEDLEPEEACEKYIMKFIPKNYRRRSMNFLNSSIIKVKNIKDYIRYLCMKRKKKFTLETRDEIKEDFKNRMIENLFNNVEYKDNEEGIILKSTLFGYFIAKYVLTTIGVINVDSRDSWVSKRFDTAGTSIKILLGSIMNSLICNCKREIEKFSTNPDYSGFGNTLRSKAPSHLQGDFQRSFNSPFWGTKTYNKQKQNVTETTRRDTPLLLWSMSTKNSKDVDKRDQKMSVREVHPSQRDKHCLAETPESSSVSLVKYLSTTCRLSLETDERNVLEYASEYLGKENKIIKGDKADIILMVNGRFVSHENINIVYCTKEAKNKIRYGKINGELPIDVEIFMEEYSNCLQIYTDSSRATSPYFIVNQETKNLVIDEIDGWDFTYEQLITSGAIEFLSSRECDSEETLICYSVKHFYEMKTEIENIPEEDVYKKEKMSTIYNFSHCNLDPNQLFGLTASVCPFTNHQNTTRTIFNCSMAKQALGYYNINYHSKFYGSTSGFKRLVRPTRPICESEACFIPKLDVFPTGQTPLIGFLTEPDNQEDAIVVSEDFVNSGNLNYIKYTIIKYTQPSFERNIKEIFQRPVLRANESPEKYVHIQENGFPKLDSYVREGDCIIGKVKRDSRDGKLTNNSLMCGLGEEGYVDRIIVTKEVGYLFISIKLRALRRYQAGDKLAIRYAQKGTIGRVEKRENMPTIVSGVNKGVTPDIIFNPLGYPSRQTVGLLIEGLVSKAAVYSGKRVDASGFTEVQKTTKESMKILENEGMNPYGYEKVHFPKRDKIDSEIVIAPIYEQILRHQVIDKIQTRSTGNKSLYTHQPKGGRAVGGGQKIGEMEKDSFVAHGATGVIRERMMKVSDEFKIVVCQNCGIIIGNKNCTLCGNSKPGILTIPYVFKLLIHLLNGVGIDIRINTKEKEIDED